MKNIVFFILLCPAIYGFGQKVTKPKMKLVKHFQIYLPDIQSTTFPSCEDNEINVKQIVENNTNLLQMTSSKSLQDPELLTNVISEKGIINGFGNLAEIRPPDPCGDVGYNYFVQANNNYFSIYDKQGNVTTDPVSFWDFWNPMWGNNYKMISDPIILFDEIANRWIMCEIGAYNPEGSTMDCWFFLASSVSDDPNLGWNIWEFNTGEYLFDYPKISNWKDGIFFSSNVFHVYYYAGHMNADEYNGPAGGAFNKEDVYSAMSNISYDYEILDYNEGSPINIIPLDNDGEYPNDDQDIYFVWFSDDNWDGYNKDALHFIPATFNGSDFVFNDQNAVNLCVDNFASYAGSAYNYNCSQSDGLDVLYDRLLFRVQFRSFNDHNSIVCCHNIKAPEVEGMNAMRWYEVRIIQDELFLYQQGTFTLIGEEFQKRDRWMGSIAMNKQGEIALGYNVVRKYEPNNDLQWIAIGLTGRKPTDVLNQMTFQELLNKNETCYNYLFDPKTVAQWGDYSMMSVDPSDGTTFWYTAELPKLPYGEGWTSKTIAFELDPCPNELVLQNQTVNPGETVQYNAFELLQAAGKDNQGNDTYFNVLKNGNVEFSAYYIVKLKPDFHANEGSFFHAFNDFCGVGGNKTLLPFAVDFSNQYFHLKNSESQVSVNNNLLSISPNPSNGVIKAKINDDTNGKIEVFDISGFEVFSANDFRDVIEIDLTACNPGIYVVRYTNGKIFTYRKIVLY